jgi:hypothetical protein
MRLLVLLLALASFRPATALAQQSTGAPINFSSLVALPPSGSITLGFVAAAVPSHASAPFYLVRAVGPSLAQFGIANPCASVSLQAFDSNGQSVSPLVGQFDWPAIFASVGAFPIFAPTSIPAGTTGDACHIFSFPNGGGYTLQAKDLSGTGGQVLVEAYYNAQVSYLEVVPQ